MVKKLIYVGVGVMLLATLTACGEADSVKEYDKEKVLFSTILDEDKNEVNEKIEEKTVEDVQIDETKVEVKSKELYGLEKFLSKELEGSLDKALKYSVDMDFDGIQEMIVYPESYKTYRSEGTLYGVKLDGSFGVLIDACGSRVELVENNDTKERFYIFYREYRDGLCYVHDEIGKFEKSDYGIIGKDIFLELCDSIGEENYREELRNTFTDVEYEDAIFNSHIPKYSVYGKTVTKDEYDRLLAEFMQKHTVLETFEIER